MPASKALIGAAFIQYLIYAFIYIIEGAKLDEFEDSSASAPTGTKHFAANQKQAE